jgi:hypothetical protein
MIRLCLVGIPTLALLQACAGPGIVLQQDAGTLADVTKQTVAQVRTFYSEQGTRRLNYYLDALAQDPNCQANPSIFIMRANSGPAPFNCLTDALRTKCQAGDPSVAAQCQSMEKLELLPATALYQSALTFVDVIADYQALLASIATNEAIDTGGELASLRTRLESLQSELQTIFPKLGLLPDKPAAGDPDPLGDQLSAVGKLLDVVREAAQAQDALAKLKEALTSHGPAFEEALRNLASRYELVDLSGQRLIERQALEAKRREYNTLVAQGKTAAMPVAERRSRMGDLLDAERVRREHLAQPDPMVSALHALSVSEGQLRDAVLDGKLTPEQRHRIAQENLKELKATFRAIATVALAFR